MNAVRRFTFLLLILFGKIAFNAATSDVSDDVEDANSGYYTYDENGESSIYENYQDELTATLNASRESLDVLFGSDEKTKTLVMDLVADRTKYWVLDEAVRAIEEYLQKNNTNLLEAQRLEIDQVLSVIRNAMKNISLLPSFNRPLFDAMNASRDVIDCAIGRHSRNDFFNAIELSFYQGVFYCEDSLPKFWRSLLEANYTGKRCTIEETLQQMLNIEQAARNKEFTFEEDEKKITETKLELIKILSMPKYREFLLPIVCEEEETCRISKEALCKPDLYRSVSEITGQLNAYTTKEVPTNPIKMTTLLDVVRSLTLVASKLCTIAKARSRPDARRNAGKTLEYYIGIINVVIGINSTEAWRQMTIVNAIRQFHQILIENDEYIGFAADVILSENSQSNTLNETSLTLQMTRLPSSQDGARRVEFSYENVQIWTENLVNSTDKSELKVYSLHYNTWNAILNSIVGRPHGEQKNSSHHQKVMIGKGGVVSFTARVNEAKRSVPVYYKMRFDDFSAFRDDTGKVVSRCLSCGYYDVIDQSWRSKGCHVTSVDDDGVTCYCNHTTNFAAFMSPYDNEYELTETQDLWLNLFEYIGSITSVVGLSLSFSAFYIVRNAVRNDRLKAHMNLVAALLFVHLIQIGAEFAETNNELCIATTVATHYFLLASFMWMLIEGVFLYFYVVQVFVKSRTESKKWMYVTGWAAPLLIVAVSAGYGLANDMYIQPDNGNSQCETGQMLYPLSKEQKYSKCWLSSISGMTWSFVGPAIVVLLLNSVILCRVVVALAKLSDRNKSLRRYRSSEQIQNTANKKSKSGIPQLLSYKTNTYEVRSDGRTSWFNSINSIYNAAQSESGGANRRFQNFDRHPVLTFNSNRSRFIKEAKKTVKGAVVLLPLLGISWIFGTVGYKSYALSMIFVILNSIQGVAIFLIYCVFNNDVYRALQRRLSTCCFGRKPIRRRRSLSSGSIKSALNIGILRNWTGRSTITPVYKSNTPV